MVDKYMQLSTKLFWMVDHTEAILIFLATLVALHFTPVSKSVSQWLSGQSFGLA